MKLGLKSVLGGLAATAMAVVAMPALVASTPASAADAPLTATTYGIARTVDLVRQAGVSTNLTLATAPLLPAGNWVLTASVFVVNSTGQADIVRCGLNNSTGGLFAGAGSSIVGVGATDLTVPALVSLSAPDRININCSLDGSLPSNGFIQAQTGYVVAQQVAARF